MATANVTTPIGRRVKEAQLRGVREDIERELSRRPPTDLTPYGQYATLVQVERQLIDELEQPNPAPWA